MTLVLKRLIAHHQKLTNNSLANSLSNIQKIEKMIISWSEMQNTKKKQNNS